MLTKHRSHLRSYGRINSRYMTAPKKTLVDSFITNYSINDAVFSRAKAYQYRALEIGFGDGEHLARQLTATKNTFWMGAEPYKNGIFHLRGLLGDTIFSNLAIWPDDIWLLLPQIPENLLTHVYILFPDPWPKRRQFKRRLIQSLFLDALARVMQSNAILTIATDHAEYASWVLSIILKHRNFSWLSSMPRDWLLPPDHWQETRYQRKALAGHTPYFLYCQKHSSVES